MSPVHLLMIEDDEDDALLVVRHLRRGGLDLSHQRVDTAEAMSAALRTQTPDIVISDNGMPTFDAASALRLLHDSHLDVPFIVVSGQIGEEAAAGLMRAGAHDFVLKDSLTRLLPAVQRELRETGERQQQRRTQVALKTSEERFRLVAEHLQDVVFRYRLEPDPGLGYVSPAVVAMTGLRPEELYDDPTLILAMVEPEDRAKMVQWWRAPTTQPVVMRLCRADRPMMWIEQRAIVVHDGPGRAVEGILRDITAQVVADQEREGLEHQLHQAERLDALGQLAGGIAHDFNNLLGVISGNAALVLEELAPGHICRADVESIDRAAGMAAALTRQLLIFSRLQPSRPEITDLNAVVADTERLLRRTVGADIEFIIATEPDLDLVTIDRSRLEQVILNLVVNARGAMPDGGRLTIATAAATEQDRSTWRGADMPPGRFIRLTVTDNGCGMPPDVARRAFEPFFTTKEAGKGTGLGLSTVYGAVKEASGTITLQSEPGEGTQINVYLPSTGRPATSLPSATTAATTGHGEHILVVDDNDALLAITARMLTKAGYHVTEASSRGQAVHLIDNADLCPDLDLLLADIVMPGMSAPDLVDAVRASRPGTPVAFMSGSTADPGRGGRPLPEDIPIISKPFDAAALLRAVRTALDGA